MVDFTQNFNILRLEGGGQYFPGGRGSNFFKFAGLNANFGRHL